MPDDTPTDGRDGTTPARLRDEGFGPALKRLWRRLTSPFRRGVPADMSEERKAALMARHRAEARRDDYKMTARTHEPTF